VWVLASQGLVLVPALVQVWLDPALVLVWVLASQGLVLVQVWLEPALVVLGQG
jgi:hypothetical protein